MNTALPKPTIPKDSSLVFSTSSITETRIMAPSPTKGSWTRRPAHQCVHAIPSGRTRKPEREGHRQQELSPESAEEARFMASLMPGRTPEQEEKIQRYRRRRAGSENPPIQLGGRQDRAMLESTWQLSMESAFPFPEEARLQAALPVQPVAHVPGPTPRPADWRAKARKVIKKKQWSLDKEMGRSTWKQKVSNDQRLLLLEDDGYDISELLVKGTTADDIITVVLARVEARRNDSMATAVAGSPYPSREDDIVPTKSNNKKVLVELNTIAHIEDGESKLPDKDAENTPERPIFILPPVIGRKRKHSDEHDEHPNWKACHQGTDSEAPSGHDTGCTFASHQTRSARKCPHGPLRKKLRRKEPAEVQQEEQEFARNSRKDYALNDIFAESRMGRILAPGLSNSGYAPSFSEIVFTRPVTLPDPEGRAAAHMNSRGLEFILDEIVYLCRERRGDGGTLSMNDPERQQSPIRITSQGPRNPVKLSGETVALKRLLMRLRDCKLLHASKYSPVELCWRKAGEVGSLSKETEDNLTRIIKKLDARQTYSGLYLSVQQYVDRGIKLQWT